MKTTHYDGQLYPSTLVRLTRQQHGGTTYSITVGSESTAKMLDHCLKLIEDYDKKMSKKFPAKKY